VGRVYSLIFAAASIANASGDYDLFEIAPAANVPVALHGIHLGQTSELGDASEEQLTVSVVRGHATGGNGSATTARPMLAGDSAAAAACETIATTPASAGTGVTLDVHTFNIRAGLEVWWPPEVRPVCSAAQTLIVVRLLTTVADDLTMNGTLYFEELS